MFFAEKILKTFGFFIFLLENKKLCFEIYHGGELMAKQFAEKIYSSQKWKRLRKQIAEDNFYICQMCGRPFSSDEIIIHHITHINQDNVDDPNVTFNSDNLCCVCRSCHAKIHRDDYRKRRGRNILFDADGNIIGIGENLKENLKENFGENHGEDGNECRHRQ